MRLNEIAQLYVDDIQEEEGIHFFHINDKNDKVIKTPQSRRAIPIHPDLIEIGFLGYCSAIKQAGFPRLWMQLSYRENSYGKKFCAFYQRLNRNYITDDPRKVFHSFRHGFAYQLKEKGVQLSIIEELLGHSHGSISFDRYGKPYTIKTLYSAVKRLKFPLLPMEQLQCVAKKISDRISE